MKNYNHYEKEIEAYIGKVCPKGEIVKKAFFMNPFQWHDSGLQLGGSDVVPSVCVRMRDGELKFYDIRHILNQEPAATRGGLLAELKALLERYE
jgi:hypothetical protein